jgi:chemotaxis protein CheC
MAIVMTEMQKSALQEAGNIGSGHAAIALSQLMNRRIKVVIPTVEIFLLKDLPSIIDGKGIPFVLISLSVLGQAKGVLIFTLEEGMALKLCDIVMGLDKDETKALGELELSALKEIGSILVASYLNAISEMTNMSLLVSVPACDVGEVTLIDKILTAKNIATKDTEEILCIKTEFVEAATRIEGYLVFAPAEDAIRKIISSLGV